MMQKNYFIAQESSRYSVRKKDFFFAFCVYEHFRKKKGFCAAGTLYMVQKLYTLHTMTDQNLFTILSISEGEIRSRTDENRSITDGNNLSLVVDP